MQGILNRKQCCPSLGSVVLGSSTSASGHTLNFAGQNIHVDCNDLPSSENALVPGQTSQMVGSLDVNTHCEYQGHCIRVSDLPSRDGVFIHIPCPMDDDCSIRRLTRSKSCEPPTRFTGTL